MAAFNDFLHTLPDPDIGIGDAGQSGTTYGRGFISAEVIRPNIEEIDRTIRGRAIVRRQATPMWRINLRYSEFTEEQFKPVYSFLMQKQNGLRPFFVELPQYKLPKNSAFATYVDSTNIITTTTAYSAGVTSMVLTGTGNDSTIPMFGDMFHIEDTNDSMHTKAYMVSSVSASGTMTVNFTPALNRNVSSGAEVVFKSPKIFVRQVGNVQSYLLNNNGLYEFALQLEEVSY